MAFINRDEISRFQDAGLVTEQAFRDLAGISREMLLKRGETGFSNTQMKNFAVHGHTCSPQVREVILNYFNERASALKKTLSNY